MEPVMDRRAEQVGELQPGDRHATSRQRYPAGEEQTRSMMDNGNFHAAQHVAIALLQGADPATVVCGNGTYGEWTAILQRLVAAYIDGGTSAVRRTYDVMARADRNVAALVAGSCPVHRAATPSMPPLPSEVAVLFQHTAPCAAWLDEYIGFARQAAPMTPRSFHEAAGLFLISTCIARRLVCSSGTDTIYPNLFILQVAEPAEYKKTTGLRVARTLLAAAGLAQLLLPDSVTPQGLSEELSLTLSGQVEQFDSERRAAWLAERAFAAQRAWLLDEAAALFDSFEREFKPACISCCCACTTAKSACGNARPRAGAAASNRPT